MSDLKEDMALWTWMATVIDDCPVSEMEQLKEEIREVWHDLEQREYWELRISNEANKARELLAKANGITQRIRENVNGCNEGS